VLNAKAIHRFAKALVHRIIDGKQNIIVKQVIVNFMYNTDVYLANSNITPFPSCIERQSVVSLLRCQPKALSF
jgi:hypothetical protein